MTSFKPTLLQTILLLTTLQYINTMEDGYLRYVKDGCFFRGEALSCIKYKALKVARKAIFGDILNKNETILANNVVSLVPLDEDAIEELEVKEREDAEVASSEPRGFLSEWTELAKYFMKLVQEFFKVKGLKVNLPEGARTVEEEVDDGDDENYDGGSSTNKSVYKRDVAYSKSARGKKKKLAVIVPLITLFAVLKMKLLLIPILLSVLLIKKLLLIAALLLPSVLSTLKACKHHHPMSYSYFGSSDSSDYAADYNNNYAYSASGGYGKDWASNRAYMLKHRPTPSPGYITAPGAIA